MACLKRARLLFCSLSIEVGPRACVHRRNSVAHTNLRNASTERYLKDVWPRVEKALKEQALSGEINLVSCEAMRLHT